MKEFIEHNRPKGSIVELVWAVIRADGYLIVANPSSKQSVLKKFTSLKPENVFYVSEINRGVWKGREARPVFVDPLCFYSSPVSEDPIMGLSLKELVRRAKLATKQETPLVQPQDQEESDAAQ